MKKLAVALSFLLLSSQAFALDVAGVNVAPTVSAGQKTLSSQRGGHPQGVLFVKVYVGSLYTERKVTTPAQLLADPGEKLIRMTFVIKKVEKEKIVEVFAEGLANNSPAVAGTAEAKAFLSWFTADFMAGDTVDVSLAADGTVPPRTTGRPSGRCGTRRLPGGPADLVRGEAGRRGLEEGDARERVSPESLHRITSGCRRSRRSASGTPRCPARAMTIFRSSGGSRPCGSRAARSGAA